MYLDVFGIEVEQTILLKEEYFEKLKIELIDGYDPQSAEKQGFANLTERKDPSGDIDSYDEDSILVSCYGYKLLFKKS